MEMTETKDTAIVEEKNVVEKLHVSGEDKRRLLILMQDWEARYRDFAVANDLETYFAKYGRYQAMYKGLISVEDLPHVKPIKLNEKKIEATTKEPLMCVDFYSTHEDARFVKQTLMQSFNLLHNPQAQTKPQTGRPNYLEGHPGARRYKMWNVTNEAASEFYQKAKDLLQLYFVDIYFWKDRTEEMPIAEVTLPKSKAQETPQILNIDDIIEEA
jgi:hypothetical protein